MNENDERAWQLETDEPCPSCGDPAGECAQTCPDPACDGRECECHHGCEPPDRVPLILGGQGRSVQDVTGSARGIALAVLVGAVLWTLAAVIWSAS